jgi:hypothetical protein
VNFDASLPALQYSFIKLTNNSFAYKPQLDIFFTFKNARKK